MFKYQPKTYLIKTFGCQSNISDSEKISNILNNLGLKETKKLSNSDIFIINTCSVRQKSEDKVYGLAKKLKELDATKDKKDKKPFCILTGCMLGSALGDRTRYDFKYLENKTPWVNLYLKTEDIDKLPHILKRNNLLESINKENSLEKKRESLKLKEKEDSKNKHAFVNISYGCDNFCTYCVVPYARGREVHRSEKEILEEINELVNEGITEITLCGQNVNSWGLTSKQKSKIRIGGGQKLPFVCLLRDIHNIEGITKIEFLSSNPFDFTQDLIDILALPKISNYIHIAVQSGNNDILMKMGRKHTVEEFIDLIKRIKEVRPEIEIGTDAIVGFPTESYNQFLDTVKLFKQIKFAVAFISMYSPRLGTVAYKYYDDNVSLSEKKKRHAYLTKIWKETKSEK